MSGVNFPPPGPFFPSQPQNDPMQNFMKAAQDFENNPTQANAHKLLAYMPANSSTVCGHDSQCSMRYAVARSAVVAFEQFPTDPNSVVGSVNNLLTYLES